MATTIDKVLDNFCWRIESTTPTSQLIRNRFLRYDPEKQEPGQSSGWYRRFYVEWSGSDEDTGASSPNRRLAWHVIKVHVVYKIGLDNLELQKLILSDRHDLIKTLRAPANRVGYSDAYPSTEVGLYNRQRSGDETSTDIDVITFSTAWRCFILENE